MMDDLEEVFSSGDESTNGNTAELVIDRTHSSVQTIDFNSSTEANIALNSLIVDALPRKSLAERNIDVVNSGLRIEIKAPTEKEVQKAMKSFMDLANLVRQTINAFGPPVQQNKKTCL